MNSPTELAERELDARLSAQSSRPLAIAISGGGDSAALLLIVKAWADRSGRRLTAFTVDHGLQPQGAAWAGACARRCRSLGIAHETLVWAGPKPRTGRAAAARVARHRLLAEAARRSGAHIVLLGHTADDALEAALMREAGVRVGSPAPWAPSPVWPEGRGLFVLRPLMGVRRAALRDWLIARGETWIEDPANDDFASPRAGARAKVREGAVDLSAAPVNLSQAGVKFAVGPAGEVSLPLAGEGAWAGELSVLAASVCCASGREGGLRSGALERLANRILDGGAVNATLGGARILRSGDEVLCVREPKDRRGRVCATLQLRNGVLEVWDGRFELQVEGDGFNIGPLAGRVGAAATILGSRLAGLHPAVRAALPALSGTRDQLACPSLVDEPGVHIRGLVERRMAAALGRIDNEAQLVS